jgi:hypothetical protein
VGAEAGWQPGDKLNCPIDAEHLMACIGEHRSETAVTCSKIKNAHGLRAGHPSDCSFRIGSPPRNHAGNFSGAGPAD